MNGSAVCRRSSFSTRSPAVGARSDRVSNYTQLVVIDADDVAYKIELVPSDRAECYTCDQSYDPHEGPPLPVYAHVPSGSDNRGQPYQECEHLRAVARDALGG